MPAHYESRIIRCDNPRFPSCHASTLVETLDGDILCVWYAGSKEGAPDVALLGARLGPQSREWTTPRIVHDTPGRCDGNPVLFSSPFGSLWLFWAVMTGQGWDTCILRAKISGETGHSWDPPVTIQETPGWMVRNKPVTLRNGEMILPLYDERDWHSFMLASIDAAHWEPRGDIRTQTGCIQPSLVERSAGSLLCLMRRGPQDPERRLWQSASYDGGRTWTAPERAPLPNPNSAAEMVRLASGHLALAFNNSPDERTPLSLALSLDDGRNWRYVRNLEEEPDEYSYPAIIQARDGRIHVTYTWKRQQIKHVTVDEEWIREGGSPFPG